MTSYGITFQSPGYLLLLLLLPLLWWFSVARLRALGWGRCATAIAVRTIVFLLVVLALAEVQMVRTSDKLTVLYLVDQSLSIPADSRQAMIRYVNAAIREHRKREDRAGVIVFGREPAIEVPPYDDAVQVAPEVESPLDPEFTNLAGAMRLAQASFPEDAAKRIVIVSDGNENIGDALETARGLAAAGVSIDVVPIRYLKRGEVMVERVAVPQNVRQGQPFDMKVVVTNTRQVADGQSVKGRLTVKKWAGDQVQVVSEGPIELPPGKQVYTVRQELDSTGFYTYEATFTPDETGDDTLGQNNRATTFTHIRGKGQVLVIEDSENRGRFTRFAEALRSQKFEVVFQPTDQLFTTLEALQPYAAVVLANVPREAFSDDQIEMLVRNTQQMGAGLVMLGGENSFGAGGWANTELEKALPVDCQIQNLEVAPVGALCMLMHASEIAQGNYWQKVIGEEALKTLGPQDYCGVVHYGNGCEWLWRPGMRKVSGSREMMLGKIDKMIPGDMPDFDPGLRLAYQGFQTVPTAAIKHMIVISDGDPSRPSAAVVTAVRNANITVSTVAVGAHGPADSRTLSKLAADTGGKYYQVNSPKALPRIFQREARRVAQPLVYENKSGFAPVVMRPAPDMIRGLPAAFPPATGYVMTTIKENPLVELALLAPLPTKSLPKNRTLLAGWTYGLGRTAAFTSDAGHRWTANWTGWDNYDKFFGQTVAWAMRQVEEGGQFTLSTELEGEQIRVVVTALDKQDEFLNFLDMTGTVVGPDLTPIDLKMEQTAPGRYVGTIPARSAGSYFVLVSPGPGKAPLRTGVTLPYSDEFRGRPPNEPLLENMAGLVPDGGRAGVLINAPEDFRDPKPLLATNSFRHDLRKATSSQDIWFLVMLAACVLFFLDVLVRRVQFSFAWAPALARRLLWRAPAAAEPPTLERLRSRKAAVGTQIEQIKAKARFEPLSQPSPPPEVAGMAEPPPADRPAAAPGLAPGQKGAETYTERLLRAKKKVWKDREEK